MPTTPTVVFATKAALTHGTFNLFLLEMNFDHLRSSCQSTIFKKARKGSRAGAETRGFHMVLLKPDRRVTGPPRHELPTTTFKEESKSKKP
jgi:hypothetical protein